MVNINSLFYKNISISSLHIPDLIILPARLEAGRYIIRTKDTKDIIIIVH